LYSSKEYQHQTDFLCRLDRAYRIYSERENITISDHPRTLNGIILQLFHPVHGNILHYSILYSVCSRPVVQFNQRK